MFRARLYKLHEACQAQIFFDFVEISTVFKISEISAYYFGAFLQRFLAIPRSLTCRRYKIFPKHRVYAALQTIKKLHFYTFASSRNATFAKSAIFSKHFHLFQLYIYVMLPQFATYRRLVHMQLSCDFSGIRIFLEIAHQHFAFVLIHQFTESHVFFRHEAV